MGIIRYTWMLCSAINLRSDLSRAVVSTADIPVDDVIGLRVRIESPLESQERCARLVVDRKLRQLCRSPHLPNWMLTRARHVKPRIASVRCFHLTGVRRLDIVGSALQSTAGLFQIIHNVGLPWSVAIPMTTVLLRSTVTLPVAIYVRQRMIRLAKIQNLLKAWQNTLRVSAIRTTADPVEAETRVDRLVGEINKNSVSR
jgi:hypothetical protein